jgi:hypothetical protein
MKPPSRRAALVGVILMLAAFAVGFFAGWNRSQRDTSWVSAVGQGYMLSEIAYGQYQEAGYEEAKAALE